MYKYILNLVALLIVSISLFGQQASILKKYPQSIADGSLKLNKSYFFYKSIHQNELKMDSIEIFNDSESELVLEFVNQPAYINLQQVPNVLKPKEKGIIKIQIDASKNIDNNGEINWGKDYKRIPISIKNKENLRNARTDFITVRAFLEEDFSHLSEKELKRAPKAIFDTIEYNFGKVPQGTVVIHDFIVENKGKDDLDIRYAKGC
jgi:hypothetical protein